MVRKPKNYKMRSINFETSQVERLNQLANTLNEKHNLELKATDLVRAFVSSKLSEINALGLDNIRLELIFKE